jgi:cytochrome c biogenesis protein CcmG/thiol:disulfide interchange protein DsbE
MKIAMGEPTDPRPESQRRSPLSWALMTASLALVFGLLGLLVYRVAQGNPGKGLIASVREGKKPMAPEFRLKVLWGHTDTWDTRARQALADSNVSLSELRGKPVVLNFWASWCIPCGREAPRLAASAIAHRGEVVFLGLDVKDFSGDARKFLRKYKVNYVSVRDGGSRSYNEYGLTGLPETYFLDLRGHIVSHVLGEISRAQLENGIETLTRSR